jgi:hypothetical protein
MSVTRVIVLKLVAVFCITPVILAIVLAHRSPATVYRLSIYTSTPFPVLWLLLLSLTGGIDIVVHQLFTSRYEESRTYLMGFAVILLGTIAYLCLSFVGDYVTSTRSDQSAHLGYLGDLSRTGHIGDNPYPIAHTLLCQITSNTGLPVLQIANLNTAFISCDIYVDDLPSGYSGLAAQGATGPGGTCLRRNNGRNQSRLLGSEYLVNTNATPAILLPLQAGLTCPPKTEPTSMLDWEPFGDPHQATLPVAQKPRSSTS